MARNTSKLIWAQDRTTHNSDYPPPSYPTCEYYYSVKFENYHGRTAWDFPQPSRLARCKYWTAQIRFCSSSRYLHICTFWTCRHYARHTKIKKKKDVWNCSASSEYISCSASIGIPMLFLHVTAYDTNIQEIIMANG